MIKAFDLIDNLNDRCFIIKMEEEYHCHYENEYRVRLYHMDKRLLGLVAALETASDMAA